MRAVDPGVRAVEDVARAEQDEDPGRVLADEVADQRDDDRRDDEERDDDRRGVGPSRRIRGDQRGQAAEQPGGQQAPAATNCGTDPISFWIPVTGSGATKMRPPSSRTCGHEDQQQQRDPQAAGLGQGVVDAGQDPREVQRQDAVALVAPEQLRPLGGREQHDQDDDDAVVRGEPDGRGVLEDRAPPPGAWAASAEIPTASTAGRRARMPRTIGTILARPPRPIP